MIKLKLKLITGEELITRGFAFEFHFLSYAIVSLFLCISRKGRERKNSTEVWYMRD